MNSGLFGIETGSSQRDQTNEDLKTAAWVSVLNDDDTFTGLDGCWIAPTLPEVVEALNEGEYEVNEAPVTRYSLQDLLEPRQFALRALARWTQPTNES